MSGTGEKYSFWNMGLYGTDPLRDEFGSYWGYSLVSPGPSVPVVSIPDFGFEAPALPFEAPALPRFDIEYGPVVETTAEFAPYVAHHQQVKLIGISPFYAETLAYGTDISEGEGGDCIDCGFLDDALQSLILDGSHTNEWLLMSPASILSYFPDTISYSSMGEMTVKIDDGQNIDPPSACWHDISTPLNEEDVYQAFLYEQPIGSYMEGRVTFEYGDYIENLEQVQSTLDEEDIPNFYLLLSEMDSADDLGLTYSPMFDSAVKYLNGECPELALTLENASTGFKDFLVSAMTTADNPFHNQTTGLPDFNGYKEYFPMRAETEFSTSTTEAGIADKIKKVNLDCRLLKWMTEKGPEAGSMSTKVIYEKLDESDGSTLISVEPDSELNIKSYDLFKFCGTYGEDVASLAVPLPSDMAVIVIGDGDASSLAVTDAVGDGSAEAIRDNHLNFSNLLTQALSGLNGYNKTYQQVFGGSKPHSETMAYRISKYKKSEMFAGAATGTPTTDQLEIVKRIIENDTQAIQNVWLANSSAVDVMEYVDTQMKYNENYVFVVWAYNLVLGTRYFYSNYRTSESDPISFEGGDVEYIPDVDPNDTVTANFLGAETLAALSSTGWNLSNILEPDPAGTTYEPGEFYQFTTNDSLVLDITDNCEVTFTATTMPMAVIKEVPYFVWPGSIMDKPPIVPDVNLIPYCENDSELLILLNNSAGTDFLMEPIAINDGEQSIFDEIREAQGSYDGEIEFGSDNPVAGYEVYRTTETPSSYSDFAGTLLTTVSTVFDEDLGRSANAASYIDDVESGVTYYYTFRSIDEHGHFSNPTAIYEVELYNEDGVFIPTISILEMEEEVIKDSSKPVQSALHIVPRMTQAVAQDFSDPGPPELGVETESPWGKTFKIRMTSRKTRRKFDINITFGTEHVQSELLTDPCEIE